MVIRTERYLKHVILYFIYVLSPIYNFTFLILSSRVSKITAIIFSIIFLTSIFFDIFTFFLNFKIKRVFFHKIIKELDADIELESLENPENYPLIYR